MFQRASTKAALLVLALVVAGAQTLTVEEYEPKSTLVVPEHPISGAKYPVIDVHSHHSTRVSGERLDEIVQEMDTLNLGVLVNLSGRSGASLKNFVESYRSRHPKRFAVFANLNFNSIGDPNWGKKAAAQLEHDVRAGAQGLKIFKNLGLRVRDRSGQRVPVDDPRLDPIWKTCARLEIPVLIHVAEPASFFEPHDRFNERWLELKTHPSRARPPGRFPRFEELMKERDALLEKHPDVNFILAHLGWHGNDLARLGKLFDRYPNCYADVAAVLYELGRQPFTGRKWMTKYQDRILFGKDRYQPSEFPYYWRVFETRDEYFDYYRRYHAHWKLYGLDLPDPVLKKVYYKNALRLIPGIDSEQFPP